jgi:flagellar operon protein
VSPLDGVKPVAAGAASSQPSTTAPGFRDLVNAGVTFSRHAQQRMQERQIHLSTRDLSLLHQAMSQAHAAGAKQAAVVMDPGIFIVAPGKGTVITTVSKGGDQPMQLISNVDALVLVGRTSAEEASSPRPTDGGQPAVHWSLIQNTD